MRRLILVLALLPVAAAADVVQPARAGVGGGRPCAVDDRVAAAAHPGTDGFRRLDRLPPAKEYLTVYRTIDRCPAPVIVRADVTPRR